MSQYNKEFYKEMKERNCSDPRIDTALKQALYDNLGKNADLAVALYGVIESNAQTGFREQPMRKKKLLKALQRALDGSSYDAEEILRIIIANDEF